jgi:AraC-like DNA-binding protein
LAAHFKRVYGVSPKAFLQQVRNKRASLESRRYKKEAVPHRTERPF